MLARLRDEARRLSRLLYDSEREEIAAVDCSDRRYQRRNAELTSKCTDLVSLEQIDCETVPPALDCVFSAAQL